MLIIFEPFKRINKFDFDADSTFDLYDAALAYVKNPLSTAYVGQRIFVRSSSIVEGSNNDILGKVYIVKKKYDRNDDGEILHDANGENIIEWYLDEYVTVDNFIEIFNRLPKYSISTNTMHVTKIEGSLDRVLLHIGAGNYNVDGDYVLTLGDDNTHYSNYTSTFGSQNIAGMKAFKIYDHNTSTKTIRLDSVEGIAVGMVYSTRLEGNWFNSGKIVSIDAENNTVTVDDMINKNVSNASEDLGYYLMFVDHPQLGTTKIGTYSSARGQQTYAGYQAFAEGYLTRAMGRYSHAEGFNTFSWYAAHGEGNSAKAIGNASHAEGTSTVSHGTSSHAEGYRGAAYGVGAHKEGSSTTIISTDPYQNISQDPEMTIIPKEVLVNRDTLLSFWEGTYTGSSDITTLIGKLVRSFQIAYGTASHAEGKDTLALNTASHAEGVNTVAYGECSHAEGSSFKNSKDQIISNIARGNASHVEGQGNIATGNGSHAEGRLNSVSGDVSHAEGMENTVTSSLAHVEGYKSSVSGYVGHAEGQGTTASGEGAHAEGGGSVASGFGSHAEGATYNQVHTTASGKVSHAEGQGTIASGEGAHAEGRSTQAKGAVSHAEGMETVAEGAISHVEGRGTKSSIAYQHVQGIFNAPDNSAAHIVGWGTSDTSRKNIHTLSTGGNAWFAGNVKVGGTSYGQGKTLATEEYVTTSLTAEAETARAAEKALQDAIDAVSVPVIGTADDEKVISVTDKKLVSTLSINKSKKKDGKTYVQLIGKEGAVISEFDADGFVADGMLESVTKDISTNEIVFKWNTTAGISETRVDIDDLVEVYTAGNGIDIIDFIVSIKKDATSESFLTVGVDGIKLSGVQAAIDTAKQEMLDYVNEADKDWTQEDETQPDYIKNRPSIRAGQGSNSIVEGTLTEALGENSHAEGQKTMAIGKCTHTEGYLTTAGMLGFEIDSVTDVTMNYTEAKGDYSYVYQFNIEIDDNTVEEFPIGTIVSFSYTYGKNIGWKPGVDNGKIITQPESIESGIYKFIIASNLVWYDSTKESRLQYKIYNRAKPNLGTHIISSIAHSEGRETIATGYGSHAEGGGVKAQGDYAHAEGVSTNAIGQGAHAEGNKTTAEGEYSHAEGKLSQAYGCYSHAEGVGVIAGESGKEYDSQGVHAEGYYTDAIGEGAHAEGANTNAIARGAHAEGHNTTADAQYAHAEGDTTSAHGQAAHAEGTSDIAFGISSHAEGLLNCALGEASHAEGVRTNAGLRGFNVTDVTDVTSNYTDSKESYSYVYQFNVEIDETTVAKFPINTIISFSYSTGADKNWYVGDDNGKLILTPEIISTGLYKFTIASNTVWYNSTVKSELARKIYNLAKLSLGDRNATIGSHSEGYVTKAIGDYSHAEGNYTKAIGGYSHAEGNYTTTTGLNSHAEGNGSKSTGDNSHAEGHNSSANGLASHAEGTDTVAGQKAFKVDHVVDFTANTSEETLDGYKYCYKFYVEISSEDALNFIAGQKISFSYTGEGYDGWWYAANDNGKLVSAPVAVDGYYCFEIITDIVWYEDQGEPDDDSVTIARKIYDVHKPNLGTDIITSSSHAEGDNSIAAGKAAHAEGSSTIAANEYSHAEGLGTTASGQNAHVEGKNSIASGGTSHAEGHTTTASGRYSHAEGARTVASHDCAHAEGHTTEAIGSMSHAEGWLTKANGHRSHAEGNGTEAIGENSHAEGEKTFAHGNGSHSEGNDTKVYGRQGHAEGLSSVVGDPNDVDAGLAAHAEGYNTTASGVYSHAEGAGTVASNSSAHAEGHRTSATGNSAHAEGLNTKALGHRSHAEGNDTTAGNIESGDTGESAHAEGHGTTASAIASHAEGESTTASGNYSHTEGFETQATLNAAHAEGGNTKASGHYAHAEGYYSQATANYAHVEGQSAKAAGIASHAEGKGTIASGEGQHVQGRYNISDSNKAHIVGGGFYDKDTSTEIRKNIHTLDWNGNAWFAGDVTVGPSKETLVKQSQLDTLSESIEKLKASVSSRYNFKIDNTPAYMKQIHNKALPYASVDILGGRVSPDKDGSYAPIKVTSIKTAKIDLNIKNNLLENISCDVYHDTTRLSITYKVNSKEFIINGTYDADSSTYLYFRDNSYISRESGRQYDMKMVHKSGTVSGKIFIGVTDDNAASPEYSGFDIEPDVDSGTYYGVTTFPDERLDHGSFIAIQLWPRYWGEQIQFDNFVFSFEIGDGEYVLNDIIDEIHIPDEVQNLPDYGVGKSLQEYNYINFESLTFVRKYTLTDGVVTKLPQVETIDISPYFDNGDINIGGKSHVIFENATGEEVANRITYQIKLVR